MMLKLNTVLFSHSVYLFSGLSVGEGFWKLCNTVSSIRESHCCFFSICEVLCAPAQWSEANFGNMAIDSLIIYAALCAHHTGGILETHKILQYGLIYRRAIVAFSQSVQCFVAQFNVEAQIMELLLLILWHSDHISFQRLLPVTVMGNHESQVCHIFPTMVTIMQQVSVMASSPHPNHVI